MKERIFENKATTYAGCAIALIFGGALIIGLLLGKIDGATFGSSLTVVGVFATGLILAKDKKDE